MKAVKYPIKVDFASEQILISNSFAKKASVSSSKEYKALTKVQASYPGYKIEIKQVKKNPAKESYKGLTYDYMRRYIIKYTPSPELSKALAELEDNIFISLCHSEAKRYPTVKKWFLKKYPRIEEFGLDLSLLDSNVNNSALAEVA